MVIFLSCCAGAVAATRSISDKIINEPSLNILASTVSQAMQSKPACATFSGTRSPLWPCISIRLMIASSSDKTRRLLESRLDESNRLFRMDNLDTARNAKMLSSWQDKLQAYVQWFNNGHAEDNRTGQVSPLLHPTSCPDSAGCRRSTHARAWQPWYASRRSADCNRR